MVVDEGYCTDKQYCLHVADVAAYANVSLRDIRRAVICGELSVRTYWPRAWDDGEIRRDDVDDWLRRRAQGLAKHKLLALDEACLRAGLDPSVILRAVGDRELKAVKFLGSGNERWRFVISVLDEWVKRRSGDQVPLC